MRHTFRWFFIALATVAASTGCATAPAHTQPRVALASQVFSVELATTPAAQAHGLMERTSMEPSHGMLFVFQADEPRTFWMKDTRIPLDILFFDAHRRLVTIQADAQPCHADPCRLYPSNVPARYVLELNAGTASRIGAKTGDVMTISGIPSGIQ